MAKRRYFACTDKADLRNYEGYQDFASADEAAFVWAKVLGLNGVVYEQNGSKRTPIALWSRA